MRVLLVAVLVIVLQSTGDCYSLLFGQTTQESAIQESNPLDTLQTYYLCASANISTNARNVGIGLSDGAPLTTVGISFIFIGNKLFNSRNLRTSVHLEKIMNGYAVSSFLTNYRMQATVGYNVITEELYRLYPFVGIYGLQSQAVDKNTNISSIPFQLGIGGEFLPKQTPFILGVQCSYQYILPLFSLLDNKINPDNIISSGLSGFNARVYVGFHLLTE